MTAAIEFTVALPVWRSKDIAWLAMESLANQDATNFGWELLVCEEDSSCHDGCLGAEFFESYRARLFERGCHRLLYLPLSSWIPLPQKWRMMGLEMSATSRAFMLQAADCYSFKERINESYNRIALDGNTWYDVNNGYFYSFISNKLIRYLAPPASRSNLNMAFHAAAARTIPMSTLPRHIDGFLRTHCRKTTTAFTQYVDTNVYVGVDTNGYNNISTTREAYFIRPSPPFFGTSCKLDKLGLPDDVTARMLQMQNMRVHHV